MKKFIIFIFTFLLMYNLFGNAEQGINIYKIVATHFAKFVAYDPKYISYDKENNIIIMGTIEQYGLTELPLYWQKIPFFNYKENFYMMQGVKKGEDVVVGFYPVIAEVEVIGPDGMRTKQFNTISYLSATIPASDFQNKTGRYLKP